MMEKSQNEEEEDIFQGLNLDVKTKSNVFTAVSGEP